MTSWWFRADYFESCNCAHGCPCNVTTLPTYGSCNGLNAYSIREGAADGVRLDGCRLAILASWPGPIHHGGGRGAVFVDDSASPAQCEALARIGSGQAGEGGPFAVFLSTFVSPPEVHFVPIRIDREGDQARLRFGTLVDLAIGPVRREMDGAASETRLVIPGGFIFQDARIMNTERCEVKTPGVAFQHAGSSAFVSQVAYNV